MLLFKRRLNFSLAIRLLEHRLLNELLVRVLIGFLLPLLLFVLKPEDHVVPDGLESAVLESLRGVAARRGQVRPVARTDVLVEHQPRPAPAHEYAESLARAVVVDAPDVLVAVLRVPVEAHSPCTRRLLELVEGKELPGEFLQVNQIPFCNIK